MPTSHEDAETEPVGPPAVRWWSREWFRQSAAIVPGIAAFLLVPGTILVSVLAFWNGFAVVYLVLTWLTYRRRDGAGLRALALASRRRSLTDRLLAVPPEQFPPNAAFLALVATVIAMPMTDELGTSPAVVLTVCILAVLTCWLVLQVSFAIVYLSDHTEHGGLDFPGDEEPLLVDVLYFALAVGTTFGTTDVTVTTRAMRRRVLTHGLLGFVFNTLVLAAVVAIVTTTIVNS